MTKIYDCKEEEKSSGDAPYIRRNRTARLLRPLSNDPVHLDKFFTIPVATFNQFSNIISFFHAVKLVFANVKITLTIIHPL